MPIGLPFNVHEDLDARWDDPKIEEPYALRWVRHYELQRWHPHTRDLINYYGVIR